VAAFGKIGFFDAKAAEIFVFEISFGLATFTKGL
jgi:hypothetical protein